MGTVHQLLGRKITTGGIPCDSGIETGPTTLPKA
jgi:hypothetical protein